MCISVYTLISLACKDAVVYSSSIIYMSKPPDTTAEYNLNIDSEIPDTPLAYFWYMSKPFKKWVWGSVVVVITAAIVGKSSAYFFKLIVDAVEAGDQQAALWYALAYPLVIFVEQLLFRASALLLRGWVVQSKSIVTTLCQNI